MIQNITINENLKEITENSVNHIKITGGKLDREGITKISEALRENTSIDSMEISWNSVGPTSLSEVLKSITSLNIHTQFIRRKGATKLSEILKSNSSLTELYLSCNCLGNKGALKISEALKQNSSLTDLDLGRNGITNKGATILSDALKHNSSLTSLGLSENKICRKGTVKLSEALKSNSSLTSLDLNWNIVGDEGAIKIAETLKLNTSLTKLNLSNNDIDTEGAKKLAQALESNSSLTSLDLKNINADYTIDAHVLETIERCLKRNKETWREVHDCIRTNGMQQLTTLLSKHSLNLNSFNLSEEGNTLLHSAVQSGTASMMRFLLEGISPSTKERMLKMRNKHQQLPTELLTVWSPETPLHPLLPLKFRQLVQTVFILAAKRQDGTPHYPQAHFYKLPAEMLCKIVQYALPYYN